jgi:PAS domain S-box-containing protein
MNSNSAQTAKTGSRLLRSLALYGIVFFLITVMLTAFVIVPRIDNLLESERSKNIQVDLAFEAQLFIRFVESQKTVLQDLANFPSIVNSARLGDAFDPVIIDLFENVVISGKAGRVVLQDIAGTVLIQSTTELQGSYGGEHSWFKRILNSEIPYHFRLLSQNGDRFTFQISVPIRYNDYVEGVLSAEISVLLDQVFIALSFDEHIAFKLVQKHMTIATDINQIEIAREESVTLESPDLTFTFITDEAIVKSKKTELKNTILLVLLIGLAVSFLLFAAYGYRNLIVRHKKNSVKPLLNRIYTVPIIVAIVGIAASTTAFLVIQNLNQVSVERQQLAASKAAFTSIRERIRGNLIVLDSVKAFFDGSSVVDRSEFEIFLKPLLANHKSIKAVAWLPNVSSSQRDEFENAARLDGIANYEFREFGPNGTIIAAGKRDNYFPVFFAEPLIGNESAFGFDLASSPKRLSAMTDAGKSGYKAATAPLRLVDGKLDGWGILVFYPVYNTSAVSNGRNADSVKGFIQLVLSSNALVADTLENSDDVNLLHILDVTNANKPEEVYGVEITDQHTVHGDLVDVAGRLWRIDVAADGTGESMLWVPWLVLASGLISVGLITIGLIHLIRRRELVELLVAERTTELRMLSSVVANSNVIFTVTEAGELDPEHGDPKILYVNEAFSRLTGYSYEEALGKSAHLLEGKNTDPLELDKKRQALEQGKPYVGELLSYTKKGTEFWVDINIFPLLDAEGNIVQFAAVQRDITDRKEAQAYREKLINQLTDSNEELERFAFVCSHDLQEPLRMIRSFSEKLQTHIADDLENDEKGRKYFGFITDGATRAQDLIADILAYSSITNDTAHLEAVDGQNLIESVKNTMHVAMMEEGARISSDVLPVLHGNKTQLYQLFQNLINNGIKYTRADVTPHVHIGVTDAAKYWQFSVKDNGIGMEHRHLSKIFDVFQRLHRKSEYAGTGVGLSICRKVVTRHGGTLWVESEVGVGSTFHFTLLKPTPIEVDYEVQRKAS